jgi:hypothetical protein
MLGIFILVTLIALVSFIYGYVRGTYDQREATAKALARMAREAAQEMKWPEAG